MKKFLIGMFAFVLCLGMNSCKKEAPAAGADAEKAATEKVEEAPSLADVVAKAKAEGANWSVDEWKESFKSMALAIKPMMVKLSEIQKKVDAEMEKDPSKALGMLEDLKKVQDEFPDFEKLMDEFTQIAESTENGKQVANDEEWGKQLFKELDIPEVDM